MHLHDPKRLALLHPGLQWSKVVHEHKHLLSVEIDLLPQVSAWLCCCQEAEGWWVGLGEENEQDHGAAIDQCKQRICCMTTPDAPFALGGLVFAGTLS